MLYTMIRMVCSAQHTFPMVVSWMGYILETTNTKSNACGYTEGGVITPAHVQYNIPYTYIYIHRIRGSVISP